MVITMNSNHEKFRKWLEIARRVRPNSPFLKMERSVDEYLKGQVKLAADGLHWIYVGIEEAKACDSSNKPNVWFRVNKDNNLTIGLSFNSNGSVAWAKNILEGYSADVKEELFNHIKSDTNWKAILYMRKKFHFFGESPTFEEWDSVPISELEKEKIEQIFEQANEIIDEYRERINLPANDPSHLVMGGGASFDLLQKDVPANDEEFAKAFAFAHDALEICLKIKTPAQNKREMNKKYEAYQCKNRYCSRYSDPKKDSMPVCNKCGTNCKTVLIIKEDWESIFGYPPEEKNTK